MTGVDARVLDSTAGVGRKFRLAGRTFQTFMALEMCNKERMIISICGTHNRGAQWQQPHNVVFGDTSSQNNGWGCSSVCNEFQGRRSWPIKTLNLTSASSSALMMGHLPFPITMAFFPTTECQAPSHPGVLVNQISAQMSSPHRSSLAHDSILIICITFEDFPLTFTESCLSVCRLLAVSNNPSHMRVKDSWTMAWWLQGGRG